MRCVGVDERGEDPASAWLYSEFTLSFWSYAGVEGAIEFAVSSVMVSSSAGDSS